MADPAVLVLPVSGAMAVAHMKTDWRSMKERFGGSSAETRVVYSAPYPRELGCPWTHPRCQLVDEIDEEDEEAMRARSDWDQWRLKLMYLCDEDGNRKRLPANQHIPGLLGEAFMECLAVNQYTGDCCVLDLDPDHSVMAPALHDALAKARTIFDPSRAELEGKMLRVITGQDRNSCASSFSLCPKAQHILARRVQEAREESRGDPSCTREDWEDRLLNQLESDYRRCLAPRKPLKPRMAHGRLVEAVRDVPPPGAVWVFPPSSSGHEVLRPETSWESVGLAVWSNPEGSDSDSDEENPATVTRDILSGFSPGITPDAVFEMAYRLQARRNPGLTRQKLRSATEVHGWDLELDGFFHEDAIMELTDVVPYDKVVIPPKVLAELDVQVPTVPPELQEFFSGQQLQVEFSCNFPHAPDAPMSIRAAFCASTAPFPDGTWLGGAFVPVPFQVSDEAARQLCKHALPHAPFNRVANRAGSRR